MRVVRKGTGLLLVAVLFALSGCNYSFRAGSGFPPHVRTIAILPFENDTGRFELTQEIHQALLRELPSALGIRPAAEGVADAVVRGRVRRYSLDAPLFRGGGDGQRAEVLERQVSISLSVEIIDTRNNVILWEEQNISAQGQYLEASETEDVGRSDAITRLVQRIVDGSQSNW